LPGGALDGSEGNQYEIVFIEGEAGFELPGESSTESVEGVLRPEPIQRASLPSTDGQDRLCDQSED
jgi:hypothetical protein